MYDGGEDGVVESDEQVHIAYHDYFKKQKHSEQRGWKLMLIVNADHSMFKSCSLSCSSAPLFKS